jgi:hypothetical protein
LIIKLPPLEARMAEVIDEVRPLLGLKQDTRELAAQTAAPTLAVPHHVFVIGLEDVATRDDPVPATPSSLRVFEVEQQRNRAVFDVTPADQGAPQVQSMSNDAATLEMLQNGLNQAQRLAAQVGQEPEMHFIRIPALYVEAFWLHYPDKTRDVMIPVRGSDLLSVGQTIPAQAFFATLRNAARERLSRPRDDAIAP